MSSRLVLLFFFLKGEHLIRLASRGWSRGGGGRRGVSSAKIRNVRVGLDVPRTNLSNDRFSGDLGLLLQHDALGPLRVRPLHATKVLVGDLGERPVVGVGLEGFESPLRNRGHGLDVVRHVWVLEGRGGGARRRRCLGISGNTDLGDQETPGHQLGCAIAIPGFTDGRRSAGGLRGLVASRGVAENRIPAQYYVVVGKNWFPTKVRLPIAIRLF